MGQALSEPVTVKDTTSSENAHFSVGCSSMQGWRPQMEDASTIELSLQGDPSSAYFAVFDGHGTQRFADYCSKELHKQLISDRSFVVGNYEEALKNSFLSLDHRLQTDSSLNYQHEPGGTTAVVVLIKNDTIFCANAGDSRAVACVYGNIQLLSHDHKPLNPAEEYRIFNAGGWIECNRVNGNLALSRAIGDFSFKKNGSLPAEEQIITACPDIETFPVLENYEFLVIACDGIWDVMSNEEVVEFVRRRIADNMSPETICEALVDRCLAPDVRMGGIGCDNMTVILVCFLHSGPYSNVVAKCSRAASLPATQTTAYHHWAHTKNNTLIHNSKNGCQDEEILTFGTSPRSKLNDTVSSANTDLDSELERSEECPKMFEGLPVDVTVSDARAARGRSQSDTSSEGVSWEEERVAVSMELETSVTPVETMV